MITRIVSEIVNAIIDYNRVASLGFKSIKEHAGKFTWEEFEKRGFNAPAAFVTNLGWRRLNDNEPTEVHSSEQLYAARFAIAVITQHVKDDEVRNKQARLLCEWLTQFIEDNDFGLSDVSESMTVKVDPRFMGVINNDGQCLWIIDWYHHCPICPDEMLPLDDFDGVDINHNNPQQPSKTLAQTRIELEE